MAQSAGSAQSWLLPMILGAQPPLDPSRFEPLIELLQQTRDFARLNFDLAKCLSFYQFSPKNIAMGVFLVLAKKCVHDKVVVEAGRRLVGPGASLVPPGGQDDQSWFVWWVGWVVIWFIDWLCGR